MARHLLCTLVLRHCFHDQTINTYRRRYVQVRYPNSIQRKLESPFTGLAWSRTAKARWWHAWHGPGSMFSVPSGRFNLCTACVRQSTSFCPGPCGACLMPNRLALEAKPLVPPGILDWPLPNNLQNLLVTESHLRVG